MVSFCHLIEVTHICTTAFPWYFYSYFTQLNVYLNAFSSEAVGSLKVWDYTFCLRASFPSRHRWLCQCHSHTCSAVVALAYRWALCLIWTFLELNVSYPGSIHCRSSPALTTSHRWGSGCVLWVRPAAQKTWSTSWEVTKGIFSFLL